MSSSDDTGTYTNYPHGDLGDAEPGYDPDFKFPHLDPKQQNDIETEADNDDEVPF